MGQKTTFGEPEASGGSRQRPPLLLIVVLAVWAAALWGCVGDSCEQLRGQLRAIEFDCSVAGVRVMTVSDCGCDCAASVIEDWAEGLGCIWRLEVAPPGAGSCDWELTAYVGEEPPWPTATPDPLVTRVASADATLGAVETLMAGLLQTIGAEGDCCAGATLTAAMPTPEPSWTPEATPAAVDERMCRICVESVDCGEGYMCRDCVGAWRCVRTYFPSSDCATYCEE